VERSGVVASSLDVARSTWSRAVEPADHERFPLVWPETALVIRTDRGHEYSEHILGRRLDTDIVADAYVEGPQIKRSAAATRGHVREIGRYNLLDTAEEQLLGDPRASEVLRAFVEPA
jgi:hypothetical protein